jgi:hypothetical protein
MNITFRLHMEIMIYVLVLKCEHRTKVFTRKQPLGWEMCNQCQRYRPILVWVWVWSDSLEEREVQW